MTGIELLQQTGDVETAYNLTPEQLEERIKTADALIIRSATQACHAASSICVTPFASVRNVCAGYFSCMGHTV